MVFHFNFVKGDTVQWSFILLCQRGCNPVAFHLYFSFHVHDHHITSHTQLISFRALSQTFIAHISIINSYSLQNHHVIFTSQLFHFMFITHSLSHIHFTIIMSFSHHNHFCYVPTVCDKGTIGIILMPFF
jgi:hypothetical protein